MIIQLKEQNEMREVKAVNFSTNQLLILLFFKSTSSLDNDKAFDVFSRLVDGHLSKSKNKGKHIANAIREINRINTDISLFNKGLIGKNKIRDILFTISPFVEESDKVNKEKDLEISKTFKYTIDVYSLFLTKLTLKYSQ